MAILVQPDNLTQELAEVLFPDMHRKVRDFFLHFKDGEIAHATVELHLEGDDVKKIKDWAERNQVHCTLPLQTSDKEKSS